PVAGVIRGAACAGVGGCGFFFQAEDGIRDFHVTGVQTCALPISLASSSAATASAPLSSLTSNRAALPPSATMRVATARPRPETPPVTTARIESGCMRESPEAESRGFYPRWPSHPAGRLRAPGSGLGDACRLVGLQAVRELVRPQARCEQEALADRHAELQQEPALMLGLHAFGHQPQPEAARDAGDGLADGDIGLVVRDALDEQLAQLQAVDRQPPQVVECAVAFAEIVDGQYHALFAQAGEGAQGVRRVFDQHA